MCISIFLCLDNSAANRFRAGLMKQPECHRPAPCATVPLTVIVSVAGDPVPAPLVAEIGPLVTPGDVGVPDMTPVPVSMLRPPGRPDAL